MAVLQGRVFYIGGEGPWRAGTISGLENIGDGGSSWLLVGQLMEGRHQHCVTPVGEDSVIITGGAEESGESVRFVEMFRPGNKPGEGTEQISSMLSSRRGHGCTSYTKGDTDMVVVAGGFRYRDSNLYLYDIV